MPSLRRDRETAPAAVSWSVDRRPADATPDFGDRDRVGYVPSGRRRVRRRVRRNGLPEQVFYVTDEIREYYAAQGRTLPGRAYLGSGRDTLTGHLTERQIELEAHHGA